MTQTSMKTSRIWACLSTQSLHLTVGCRTVARLLLLPLPRGCHRCCHCWEAVTGRETLQTVVPDVPLSSVCPTLLSRAEESVRERQLMAAEAGPSDAGDEGDEELEEFEELQEPPFPEPQVQPMLLCDLLALAAEVDAAAHAQESEYTPSWDGLPAQMRPHMWCGAPASFASPPILSAVQLLHVWRQIRQTRWQLRHSVPVHCTSLRHTYMTQPTMVILGGRCMSAAKERPGHLAGSLALQIWAMGPGGDTRCQAGSCFCPPSILSCLQASPTSK